MPGLNDAISRRCLLITSAIGCTSVLAAQNEQEDANPRKRRGSSEKRGNVPEEIPNTDPPKPNLQTAPTIGVKTPPAIENNIGRVDFRLFDPQKHSPFGWIPVAFDDGIVVLREHELLKKVVVSFDDSPKATATVTYENRTGKRVPAKVEYRVLNPFGLTLGNFIHEFGGQFAILPDSQSLLAGATKKFTTEFDFTLLKEVFRYSGLTLPAKFGEPGWLLLKGSWK